MIKTRRSFLQTCMLGAALSTFAGAAAFAAEYPERAIRIVVPSSPGGSGDFVARLVGEGIGTRLGQSVVIENRGGGGGNIATEAVRASAADGYTLLLTGNNHTLNVHLFSKSPYQLEDFAAVAEATRGPSVLVASTNAPFSTLEELISYAKERPGFVPFGSPGVGLPSHVAAELFQRAAGIDLVHVPYRGSGPSIADALGGQIPLVSSTLAAALPNIKAGKLRPLAVTSEERWPELPATPTVQEVLGKPFSHLTWLGIFAPAGTPEPVIRKLNATINEVLADPNVKDAIVQQGTLPQGGSTEAFQAMIEADSRESKALVESAGLKAE